MSNQSNNLLVVDLSHFDPATSYKKVRDSGIVGVIYKATQGVGFTDDSYYIQRDLALSEGLLWGAYHFADGSDPHKQAQNFLSFAEMDNEDLFCLDFEDNPDSQMEVEAAKTWIKMVEDELGREGECVFYSGNTIKDMLGDKVDEFLGERRLWLAQYS